MTNKIYTIHPVLISSLLYPIIIIIYFVKIINFKTLIEKEEGKKGGGGKKLVCYSRLLHNKIRQIYSVT